MISISLLKVVDRREGTPVAEGRGGQDLSSATVTPSTASTFSALLDEYKRQAREGADCVNASQQRETFPKPKVASSSQDSQQDQAQDADQSDDMSASVKDASATQQEAQDKDTTETQNTSTKEEKASSTSDKDATARKAGDSDGVQSDQAWVLLSSMLNQPEMVQMLQAHSSQDGEAGLSAETSLQAGGKVELPDAMKKAPQQSVEGDKALASMVKIASSPEEQKGTGASSVSAATMTVGSQSVSEAAQAQSPHDALPTVTPSPPVMQAGNTSSVALPENVQISDISVTRGPSSASSERSDAAHHQEVSVDGASYLNVKSEALYTTPSTQASATVEQNLAKSSGTTRQSSENEAGENGDQEGLGLATIDTARSNPVNALQNAPSQGALSDDGGHGEGNNQDSLLASGELEHDGQAKADEASSSGISTTFQTMINAGDVHHSGDVTAKKADTAGLATRTDEGDTGTDTHSSIAALAQKQVSHSSSKLEMTVKTADAASVRVQVTRLPDGVAEVALQGADDATTKALTKSHHDLLEQLNAAGIHSTSVKIEVLPAELGGMNGDQAQDHLGQDPSFGGQFGQGGGASQEEQRQNYDGVRSVLSSRDEDVGPVSGAENIVSHRRTLPAASSGSLNISV
ncbi:MULTISPECIES: hypothetical protein [unclassified Saccharibacter]|uniref:hypothetical protein n=1 Tax=unclassified Saccharibacter TaxID=2648722 RepID=UPI00132CA010|nr:MULTISPECIES: hypothetical protein [unclassified Saccharibacter]MXV36022.1 hypothetical protein [Saccharibacter sp. EH611]MXV56881.1 hypothetical protein [Saccharibacter sp. EH70]MXV66759.1 hypothetical protein [Saccharibacter sp. EH60]